MESPEVREAMSKNFDSRELVVQDTEPRRSQELRHLPSTSQALCQRRITTADLERCCIYILCVTVAKPICAV